MQYQKLGPYKIGKRLGRGGMGTVFEGHNTETGEAAAVKVLNAHLADESGFRERFEIEIETLKKLRHPNIVRLYGFGEEQGNLYYAMELVRGTSMEGELENGRRFTWREATQTGIKLCRALKHAHDSGVVHRDLKPANILLSDDGEVKLTDFGIAKLFGNTQMTGDGGLIGTAEYMAPEQAEGKPVTFRCDLYSLGGVMFAMLAGRPPFRTASLPEMLHLQRTAEPPPVSRFAREVPEELEQIIARLLSKDPLERATNAMLLARQLSALEHALSVRSSRTSHLLSDHDEADKARSAAATVADQAEDYDPSRTTRGAAAAAEKEKASTRATMALDEAGSQSAVKGDADLEVAAQAAPPVSRFMTIDEARRYEAERVEPQDRWRQLGQILGLLACLVLLIAGGWYFSRPLTADAIFMRVKAAADDPAGDKLSDVEDSIRDFLERFPQDPRAKTLERYQSEIELARQERQFQLRIRAASDGDLTPIERDYVAAISGINADPQHSLSQLQAIVDRYGALPEPNRKTQQCLELARRQIARLSEHWVKQQADYLQSIDASLKLAADLEQKDSVAARRIWQSIVTLYADKPWADERVAKARQKLGK